MKNEGIVEGATDTTVEVFHAGTRVAVHPRSALKWHTRTLRQLDTGADPIVCRRSAPAPPAMVETIMRTTPHPEQGFRACLEPPSALHSSRINPRAGARGLSMKLEVPRCELRWRNSIEVDLFRTPLELSVPALLSHIGLHLAERVRNSGAWHQIHNPVRKREVVQLNQHRLG